MISLHLPEDQIPPFSETIAEMYYEFVEAKIREALLQRFEEMPSDEDIVKHVVCAVDPDDINHYFWIDKKPAVGESFNMDDHLCSIAPPKIYTPEAP